jgi:lysyl-tRNA synthetase, class II
MSPEENPPIDAQADGAVRAEFQQEIRAHRLEKLDKLRERGIEPYPVRFDRDTTAAAIRAEFGTLAAGADSGKVVHIAGRVLGSRRHGGLDFADLQDESGEIQLMATRDAVGSDELHEFSDLDLGDWIGVEGTVIVTDKGELSVRVAKFELLSKSLRALPDVRRGVADPETRYRQRYLDLTLDEDSRRVFRIRSAVIATTRRVLTEKGFTEVETPVLLSQAGGAAAKPFITHHNALNIDMTLRIALELPLKRLIVGGMNRVFEIGRVFRNEGLDTRHNPEFTLLEAYQAFGDYHDMMDLTEAIIATACAEAIGTTVVQINGKDVDLKPPWRRATMAELIKENAGVEMHPSMPVADARRIADERGVEYLDVWGSGKIMSEVYDDSSEHLLLEPTFVMDHPREVSPLARAHRDDPELTERFELVVAGRELANAYSELNDPVDQAERFQTEADLQAGGDEEGEPVDDDYVKALEYGLPPTGGLGIGMDRLVMLISGAEAIRDVILFPTLRPESQDGAEGISLASDAAPSAADFAASDEPGVGIPPERLPQEENDASGDSSQTLRRRGAREGGIPTPGSLGPRKSLRPLAWLSVVVAILSLLPTATSIRFDIGHLSFIEGGGRSAGLIASVAIGLGILAVARGLSRGKRRAWAIAVILFAAAAIVHLIHGPDPISVLLSAAMLGALIWFRQDFRAHGDPGSLLQAATFVPVYLLFVFVFSSITLFAERAHIPESLSFWGNVETTYKGMIGLDGPYTYGREVFGDFFEITLIMLGVLGLLTFLYLLLRTFVQAEPPSAERRRRAEDIVRAWGDDTLDYFALRRDKNYFFSSDGHSLVAYLYVRGTAMVAADPIGPPEDTARTLDEFLGFCGERGWRVAFFAVRESDADLYKERGMHSIYLGDEAIVHPDRFSLEGPDMKAARSAVKHVGKDHGFGLIAEDEAGEELIAELNEISAEWRDGSPERGFTMELGEEVEGIQHDFVLAIAREKGGRVAGFLRFVPVYGTEPGYSLDLMRRRPDSANGLTEYLISEAALALGARGFKRLSLNFAAWGRLLDSAEDAGLSGKLQRLMAKGLNPFFQIQSLRDFNQKFDPEWVPRSIVIDDVSDLPRVAMLYASVEGFLDVPVLSRVLEPPIRQRVEAEAEQPPQAGPAGSPA